jgi:hypothetical protein
MSTLHYNGKRSAVYSFAEEALPSIDVHKEMKKSGRIHATASGQMMVESPELVGMPQIPLDFNTWLPFSAPHYQISPDPSDYILTPVIVMPSDIPNRNGVAFPLKELIAFNPDMGMQVQDVEGQAHPPRTRQQRHHQGIRRHRRFVPPSSQGMVEQHGVEGPAAPRVRSQQARRRDREDRLG